jgi:hypothetical protein
MKEEKDTRNIIFIGTGEPFPHFNTATEKVKLPDAETQKKGFYHEKAGWIIALFPQFYKVFKPKGVK